MLSRYARNECLATLVISLTLATSCVLFYVWPLAILPLAFGACVLLFYRDPKRVSPKDRNVAVSPADGKISSIHEVAYFEAFDGPAVCVRVFLSVFDVHINYCPCHAKVRSISHKPGEHMSVLNPRSAEVNEAITIVFDHPTQKTPLIAVRQIAGQFARTVYCALGQDQVVQRGAKLGIMKLGSTAELYLPVTKDQVLVRVGQRVVGAITPLAMLPTAKAASESNPFKVSSTAAATLTQEASGSDLKAYSAVDEDDVVSAAIATVVTKALPPDSDPETDIPATPVFLDDVEDVDDDEDVTDTAIVSPLEEEEDTDLTDHAITQVMQADEVTESSHQLSASDDGEILTARMENAGTDLMLHPAEHGEENQSLAASLAGLRPETSEESDEAEDALLDATVAAERQKDADAESSGDWKILPTSKKTKKPHADGLLWEEAP